MDHRLTKEVLEWYLRECKMVEGSSQRRWVDEIRKTCAQNRDEWKHFGEALIQQTENGCKWSMIATDKT